MTDPGPLPPVLLVTDRRRTRWANAADAVEAAIAGGIRFVQIREKDLPEEAVRELLRRLRDGAPSGTQFVVNGHPRIALEEAVGLHLPAASEVRVPEGVPLLLGRSAHDEREARDAVARGADYLLVGTLFRTRSKPGLAGAGPGLVERVEKQVRPVPVYGIGGIGVAEAPDVLRAGAHGVAVCGAVLSSQDPRGAAELLVETVAGARQDRSGVMR